MDDQHWILDELSIGVWVGKVPEGTSAYANRAFEKILGMPSSPSSRIEDVPDTYGIFGRDGNRYPVEKLPFSRVVATRAPVMVDDMVAQRPGGDVNIRAFGSPVFDAAGVLSHVIIAFLDITTEVEAQRDRDAVEARLSFVCSHAPIAIWCTDQQGIITLSEGAGLTVLGVEPGELVGRNVLEIYGSHPTIPGYIRRALAGEAFWYTVDVGDTACFETWLTPLRDERGQMMGLAGLSNDVSQLRKLQKTAIQNDRVMALGTLAASVAHEINNPLTYVLGYGDSVDAELGRLEGLLAEAQGPSLAAARASLARVREELGSIRAGTRRIAAITRDLRTFSRPEESTLSPVDLRAVVQSVLKLVGKEVEARGRLVVDLQDTHQVSGNEARLVQVVLNLVMNALQALPPDSPGEHEVSVRTRNDGPRAVIEVADSGPGVPVPDRERIFEPFFSTKEIGKGTGLGLFVCRNIVRGFSGEVEVTDRPGGGALFRVTLPSASELVPLLAVQRAPTPTTRLRSDGHVMLIEDDAMVARSLAQPLRAAGYRVTVAGDGKSAIDMLRERRDVDLVFCDLMMTGMTGMDVAETLEHEAPEVARKLVFMTGGVFSPRGRDFVSRNRGRTVDKPFDPVEETRRRLR